MKLVIFGASGGVGRALVSEAVAKGHDVKVVYRSTLVTPPNYRESLVMPYITDSKAIAKAIDGTQIVFSSMGLRHLHPANLWSKITSPLDLTSAFAEALCKVMQGKSGAEMVTAVWSKIRTPMLSA